MSKFIGDGTEIVSLDKELPLVTTKRLLKKLGVHKKSHAKQNDAVKKWLKDNEPNRILRYSLWHSGFIDE